MTSAILVFDIDGVLRDVSGSYRRALADTVEHFTQHYRPTPTDIDRLKAEGRWNNDWEASQELIHRYFETQGQSRSQVDIRYPDIVTFFQHRYRGPVLDDPSQWTGYISQEPLLVTSAYFAELTAGEVAWGFFSGATTGSAQFVLQRRLGLVDPVLVAMEDAPGKPDPTGLFTTVQRLDHSTPPHLPVLYAGDTVADMQTIINARHQEPDRRWLAVGILPPHVQFEADYAAQYSATLMAAGASLVLPAVTDLTAPAIQSLLSPAA